MNQTRSERFEAQPDEDRLELPFLSRWSRRKLGKEEAPAPASERPSSPAPTAATLSQTGDLAAEASPPEALPEPIDPRTGKLMSELTDEDMPDLESLDENSNLAAFMAGKVSRGLRMKALTKVFHTAKFNQVCICAEYADDYTNFTPLGDIVPHDLQQAIVREAGKLYQRLAGNGVEITPEEAQARVAAEFRGETVPLLEAQEPSDDAQANTNLAIVPADPSEPQSPDRASAPGNPEAT